MKEIKLKTNYIKPFSSNPLIDYLVALGIPKEHTSSFISGPSPADEDDPSLLLNIQEATKTAYELLTQSSTHVFIQVDSDTDGYTSAAVLLSYLKERFPNIKYTYHLHPGKEHGIVEEAIPNDCNLVFIPDAGSNDITQQENLIKQGKTVIILDHHEVSKTTDKGGIIVNNQISPLFTNKFLSGVGIVYMFIKMMDQMYFIDDIHRNYLDLTAIGIIADAMNMTSLGNNYIAYYGLKHITNKFIKALAIKQAHGIKNPDSLTKIDVAYYIAPIINGVIRSGTASDKDFVFKALYDNDNNETYEHTWRGVTKQETLYDAAARLAVNAKNRQDDAKKKSFQFLCDKIRAEGLDKHNVILVALNEVESSKINPTLTGLIAMELVKEFNRPSLVLRKTVFDNRDVFGGSGRNGNFHALPDFKQTLKDAGGFYEEGHANAFGAFLLPDQIDSIRTYFDNLFPNTVFDDTVYEVDYWFKTSESLDMNMLNLFAEQEFLWGNSIPQPKFAFSISINKDDLFIMGKDKSSLKINANGLSFVSLKNVKLIEELTSKSNPINLTIVGRPQMNEWGGKKSIQIMIDDVNIQKTSILDLI